MSDSTGPVLVLESSFAGGFMAGRMNAEYTHYDIIATGTEEAMMRVAKAANYGDDAA